MAKKLTKAQIAKNPTKAINSGKMKINKQEVPFSGIGRAAARVVGKAIVNATTGKTAARKYAELKMRDSAKAKLPSIKTKPLTNPKSDVRVKPGRTATGPGLETRGNKITSQSQKSNANKVISNSEYKVMDYFSKGNVGKAGRGASLKKIERNKAVVRAADKKSPIKINTDPTKPKGVFGPLKKKIAAKSPEGRANVKANARGLKAAQGKSLAPKRYKADSEGRRQVKRFAAPLEKANGKKTAMRMGAQTVDIGRSSMKIKPAVKNRNK